MKATTAPRLREKQGYCKRASQSGPTYSYYLNTKGLPGSIIIKTTVKRVSQSKGLRLQGSAKIKRSSRKYHHQTDCQRVPQSKGLPGSITIKPTARKCHNHKDCQGVSQSKRLPGSATIKRTARECNNQKDCQGVPQSKGLPRSTLLKRTVRECHNQND